MTAAIAVAIFNALELARLHQEEVLSRPDPPFGEWSVRTAYEIAHVGFNGAGMAIAIALPGLVLAIVLGRRAGVSASRVAGAALASMILIGLNLGRIQVAVRALTGIAPPSRLPNFSTHVLTPIVEDLLMLLAVALVLRTGSPKSGARVGLVLGIAAGIGMTVTETTLFIQQGYLESGDHLDGDVLAQRFALFGLNVHATTAALSGAALGLWLTPPVRARRVWIAAIGFAGAVAIHSLWNLLASDLATSVLTAILKEEGALDLWMVFVGSSFTAATLLLVPWILLAVIWRVRPEPGATAT